MPQLYQVAAVILAGLASVRLARAEEPKQGVEIKNSLGIRLVYISPGQFTMGSPENSLHVWG